ncbi:hypothetical protein Ancab_018384 [Ancistrocladus abbreviatus]
MGFKHSCITCLPTYALLIALIELLLTSSAIRIPDDHNQSSNIVLFPKTTHVRINNNLGGGLDLNIHCQSSTEHMELVTVIVADGQNFEWRFRPNWWGTTVWSCDLTWTKGSKTFEIYRYKRDQRRCGKFCDWFAKRGGLDGRGPPDIHFGWS